MTKVIYGGQDDESHIRGQDDRYESYIRGEDDR